MKCLNQAILQSIKWEKETLASKDITAPEISNGKLQPNDATS